MTDILAAKFSGARHWSRQVGHPSRVCSEIVASECAQAWVEIPAHKSAKL
jgi:hypothetical protein